MEHFNKHSNEANENFDLSKLLQPILQKCKDQIQEYKNQSNNPKTFDVFTDKIDAESAMLLLKSEEIIENYTKATKSAHPMILAEVQGLVQKQNQVLSQVLDSQMDSMEDKTFGQILKKGEESDALLEKLKKRPEYETDLSYQILIINLMGHLHSLQEIAFSVDEDKKKARNQFRDYLMSHNEDLKKQIADKETTAKTLDEKITSDIKLEYQKLLDGFTFDCIEIMNEAEGLYKENLAKQN